MSGDPPAWELKQWNEIVSPTLLHIFYVYYYNQIIYFIGPSKNGYLFSTGILIWW